MFLLFHDVKLDHTLRVSFDGTRVVKSLPQTYSDVWNSKSELKTTCKHEVIMHKKCLRFTMKILDGEILRNFSRLTISKEFSIMHDFSFTMIVAERCIKYYSRYNIVVSNIRQVYHANVSKYLRFIDFFFSHISVKKKTSHKKVWWKWSLKYSLYSW